MPDYVIVGGGMVAGYAAKQMVTGGLEPGRLAIISADNAVPYERPPLSKGFLAGKEAEEKVFINPPAFYGEHGIDLRLQTRVTALDPAGRTATLESGDRVEFGQLVIATGARPRVLDLPGTGADDVLYLRSLADSKHIREAAKGARTAVVVGGGFIGMEVAAVLRGRGLEVTLLFPEDRVWARLFTPEISAFFQGYYAERGVRIMPGQKVTRIDESAGGKVVGTESGQRLAADLVVAGIGVAPVTDWLGSSPLSTSDGVVVNERLETEFEGIYAAGNVARYRDVIFGKHRRIEHWDNAVEQGKFIARELMGGTAPYEHVPYFFSDVFDLSYEFWGDKDGADDVTYRGEVREGNFSVWWTKEGVVAAAFLMGDRPDEERHAPQLIRDKKPLAELAPH